MDKILAAWALILRVDADSLETASLEPVKLLLRPETPSFELDKLLLRMRLTRASIELVKLFFRGVVIETPSVEPEMLDLRVAAATVLATSASLIPSIIFCLASGVSTRPSPF